MSTNKQKIHINIMLRICALITSVLLAGNIFAATTTSSCADSTNVKEGMLWEISGNGLTQKSYLFGTCHGEGHNFTEDEVFSFPQLKNILDNVQVVGFETVIKSKADYGKMTATKNKPLDPKFLMPKGTYYKKLYDSIAHFNVVNEFMVNEMHDAEYWKKTPEYWMTAMPMKSYSNICSLATSVDEVLIKYAAGHHKELIGLESIEKHFILFNPTTNPTISQYADTTSLKEQAETLYKIIKSCNDANTTQSSQTYLDNLSKTYLENDLKKTHSCFKESNLEAVHIERNKSWIPVIEANSKKNTCLFAFGCRHLMGKDNVIELLRSQGYTVKPVL